MKRSSIKDVAAAAGVSPATVSHTVSGKRPVSPATAARVRAAMAELGYVPNFAAQSLRLGRTRTIGVLVPDIGNPFFAGLAQAIGDAAREHDYAVLLGTSGYDAEHERRHVERMSQRSVEALIHVVGRSETVPDAMAAAERLPIAIVDLAEPVEGISTFVADHAGGGRLLAEHLGGLGHERVLVLAGPERSDGVDLRTVGFEQAWGGALEIVRGPYDVEHGRAATHQRLAGRRWTAVVALDDVLAVGALRALRAAGISVPDEVSITGFDDVPTAALVDPALTTIRQPIDRLGRLALDAVLARLDGSTDRTTGHVVLDVELVVRDSTAPVAG